MLLGIRLLNSYVDKFLIKLLSRVINPIFFYKFTFILVGPLLFESQ